MKLEVHGLTKCYGKTRALDGLTLPVETARVLVLIGPSGGGKSTLLRVLGGLETAAPCAHSALVARGKLRCHARRSAQFAAGRDGLDPLLLLECALLVMIGQPPTRLDAEKRPAVRPQRHVRHTG